MEKVTLPDNLSALAAIIRADWKKVNYAAVPYLKAMEGLSSVGDDFMHDNAREIVLRFLGNAGSWRGDTAKEVKQHLRNLLAAA